MKVVKNTVPPSSVAGLRFRSPAVMALRDGVCIGAVGSLKVVNQPSMFWTLFTRLPLPELNRMVELGVPLVVLTFVPDAQLEQGTAVEELKGLFHLRARSGQVGRVPPR